ncbi:hypothetical protein EON65_07620 [archaeon]|nr:MAG: hypothetical protein EON65_07620 [archaeon]
MYANCSSPGFLNEDFISYLMQRALRESEDKEAPIFKNKGKFLKVASSSGYRNAIEEILSKPEVVSQLANVKAVEEVQYSIYTLSK